MISVGEIGPWSTGVADAERVARYRELRALALVYLGPKHQLTIALGNAITDAAALDAARAELSAMPALRRRRLLATYAALMPTRKRRSIGAPSSPAA